MPRKPLIRSSSLPYHVYGRTNNQEWFHLPRALVWDIFCHHLSLATFKAGFHVHAFVLMSNHYHLLATAAAESLDRVMLRVVREVSKSINRAAGRVNHVFGGPYQWTLIESPFHYMHAFRYVYQNPLRKDLCASVQQYPFSTLGRLLEDGSPTIPLSSHLFHRTAVRWMEERGDGDWLQWLNTRYDAHHLDGLRRALRKRTFVFTADQKTKKLPPDFIEPEDG